MVPRPGSPGPRARARRSSPHRDGDFNGPAPARSAPGRGAEPDARSERGGGPVAAAATASVVPRTLRRFGLLLAAQTAVALWVAPWATARHNVCGGPVPPRFHGGGGSGDYSYASLQRLYCASSVHDGVANTAAALGIVLAAVVSFVGGLVAHRNVVLREVATLLAASALLFAASMALSSVRAPWTLAAAGQRPHVQVDAPTLIRWACLFPVSKQLADRVDALFVAGGLLLEPPAVATSKSAGGRLLRAVTSIPGSNAGAGVDADTAALVGVLAFNSLGRLSRGGWAGVAWNLAACGIWASRFLWVYVTTGHQLDLPSLAPPRPPPLQLPTAPGQAEPAAATKTEGAAPLSLPASTDDTAAAAAAEPATLASQPDYNACLGRVFTLSRGGVAASMAVELLRIYAPQTPGGVRLAVAAEAGQVACEVVLLLLAPLFRCLALALFVQERTDVEARLRGDLAVASARADAEAAASSARRLWMRSVFHEVRNPANSVALGLESLREWRGLPPGDVDELLGMCIGAQAASTSVLNSVLSLAAIENGSFVIHAAPTLVRTVMQQVHFQLRPWAAAARVALALDVDPSLAGPTPVVLADGPRLSQVLNNFVTNALKVVDQEGAGAVTIRARLLGLLAAPTAVEAAAPGDAVVSGATASAAALPAPVAAASAAAGEQRLARVRLEVADNGPGLSREQAAVLFQPFVQLPPSRAAARDAAPATPSPANLRHRRGAPSTTASSATSGGGSSGSGGGAAATIVVESSGLGLSIAKTIVAQHGGTIGVDSELGAGATFWAELVLPVVNVDAATAHADEPPVPQAVPLSPSAGSVDSSGQRSAAGEVAAAGDDGVVLLLPPALTTTASHRRRRSRALGGESAADVTLPPPPPPPPRFLVVDDSTPNRKLLCRVLRSRYRDAVIHEAADGAEAVALVRDSLAAAVMASAASVPTAAGKSDPPAPGDAYYYSLMLLDGHMPVLSGYEAAAAVRRLEAGADTGGGGGPAHGHRHWHLPILGVTGNALDSDVAHFVACGADDCLTKPLNAAQLYAAVARHLR